MTDTPASATARTRRYRARRRAGLRVLSIPLDVDRIAAAMIDRGLINDVAALDDAEVARVLAEVIAGHLGLKNSVTRRHSRARTCAIAGGARGATEMDANSR